MSIFTPLIDTAQGVVDFMKHILSIAILLFVLVFVGYTVIWFVARIKRNRQISEAQRQMLNAGRLNVQRLRLRHLFTSDQNKKLVNVGKISSFIKVQDSETKEISHIFAVRKGRLDEYRFYKVPMSRHSSLFADVVLYDWNFRLDAENKYMVLNSGKIEDRVMRKVAGETGIDSIGLLSPVINKAVQVNPVHRMQLRMTKLVKMPDEGMMQVNQGVSGYLTGGGQQ